MGLAYRADQIAPSERSVFPQPAQADALEIEAAAKRRLADEYDAAQQRGEVAGHGGGRNFKVPTENVEATAADIGLTRKDIHEARIARDAEINDPGITKRTVTELLDAGHEPTKAALRQALPDRDRAAHGGRSLSAGQVSGSERIGRPVPA